MISHPCCLHMKNPDSGPKEPLEYLHPLTPWTVGSPVNVNLLHISNFISLISDMTNSLTRRFLSWYILISNMIQEFSNNMKYL